VTEKTGRLVGMLDVTEKEDLIITCKSGITLRTSVNTIKESGRATQGVILIRLDEGDAIAAISKIEEQDIETEVTEITDSTEIVADNQAAATDDLNKPETNNETENPDDHINTSENQ
jgi:DNA gyrase subunit A